ncbi:hypothetical protein [Sinorhizobium meliloti]|uniref:hypothetical protein n=1 Tax=Rhizobium meliloti TaxID=382 RepID=UPI001F1AB387|nr:hypothetical protein [Sinorhizobium meliloti]
MNATDVIILRIYFSPKKQANLPVSITAPHANKFTGPKHALAPRGVFRVFGASTSGTLIAPFIPSGQNPPLKVAAFVDAAERQQIAAELERAVAQHQQERGRNRRADRR